jgi:hypothetical protein
MIDNAFIPSSVVSVRSNDSKYETLNKIYTDLSPQQFGTFIVYSPYENPKTNYHRTGKEYKLKSLNFDKETSNSMNDWFAL